MKDIERTTTKSHTAEAPSSTSGSFINGLRALVPDALKEISSYNRELQVLDEFLISHGKLSLSDSLASSIDGGKLAHLLEQRDSRSGRSVMENLQDIANRESQFLSAAQRADLISEIVKDVSSGTVRQGTFATCTVARFSAEMLQRDPAYYVGLLHDLALEGSATMKSKSESLQLNTESLAPDGRSDDRFEKRTISERIVQSSMMQFAVGPGYRYDAVTDVSREVGSESRWGYRGLFDDQFERLREALFDEGVRRVDTNVVGGADASTVLDQVLSLASEKSPIGVKLNWSSSGAHQNHFVSVVGVARNGEILIRNSGGIGSELSAGKIVGDGTGQGGNGPERLALDASGLQSISRSEFEARLRSALIPDSTARGVTSGGDTIADFAKLPHAGEIIMLQAAPDYQPMKSIRDTARTIKDTGISAKNHDAVFDRDRLTEIVRPKLFEIPISAVLEWLNRSGWVRKSPSRATVLIDDSIDD